MRTYDAQELQIKLEPTQLKPLYKINSYRHVVDMAINWIIIIGCMYLWSLYPSPWLYFVAVIVIGARMHALAVLMHDASHYRFLKNRKWNDKITNLFTMYPIFSSIDKYRRNHLAHHQKLNTEEDPDWVAKLGKQTFTFPKSKAEFFLTLGSYLILYKGISDALWFLRRFGGETGVKNSGTKETLPKIIFYIILISFLSYFGFWKYYLMFWIVPYLSTFFMFQYIRSVAEHFGGLTYDNLLSSTRTVRTTFIEKFFIAPHNVGYHLEHHLYPGVPYYNLPKLHRLLMERGNYKEEAHITNGYANGLLRELST